MESYSRSFSILAAYLVFYLEPRIECTLRDFTVLASWISAAEITLHDIHFIQSSKLYQLGFCSQFLRK